MSAGRAMLPSSSMLAPAVEREVIASSTQAPVVYTMTPAALYTTPYYDPAVRQHSVVHCESLGAPPRQTQCYQRYYDHAPPQLVSYSARNTLSAHRKTAFKAYIRFSDREHEMLRNGVERYGIGRWKCILNAYPFHPKRTAVDLKDKWRNILRKHARQSADQSKAAPTCFQSPLDSSRQLYRGYVGAESPPEWTRSAPSLDSALPEIDIGAPRVGRCMKPANALSDCSSDAYPRPRTVVEESTTTSVDSLSSPVSNTYAEYSPGGGSVASPKVDLPSLHSLNSDKAPSMDQLELTSTLRRIQPSHGSHDSREFNQPQEDVSGRMKLSFLLCGAPKMQNLPADA